jgi:signal transduction histidine kinase
VGLFTFLWSLNAAIALTLAVVCALVWLVDRRDVAKLMFCVTAVATAAATPFELGMMQATTAAELARQLRWYHLPIFFTLIGQLLFVRYYLGTGRSWLLWTIIPIRVFVLVANFLVEPNYNFREISSLGHIEFLGERVSVIGESTPREWQVLAVASLLLLMTFVLDATIQRLRQGGIESRRRALTVGLAIVVPLGANLTLNQLVALGVLHIPICATLLFLGTLAVIGYELGRELVVNSRARLQLAELRRDWAQVERVNALGQLASALAHELSQPVAATLINVDAARKQLTLAHPDLDELRSILDDIHKDNLRAGEIIDRMRSFIKKSSAAAQPFGFDQVAQDVLALLRHEATARRVDLQCTLPTGLPSAFGDRVHISQVILNLLINGMDAVQERPANNRRVLLEVRSGERDNLEIAVSDSGPGIPEGRFEEIFNPLFTTKAAGLGVGLALSRMIVDAHGGRLWAENAKSGGAVFRFTLPQGPKNPVPAA